MEALNPKPCFVGLGFRFQGFGALGCPRLRAECDKNQISIALYAVFLSIIYTYVQV